MSLENVEYATAINVLRDSGNTVTLVIKRRVATIPAPGNVNFNQSSMGNHQHSHSLSSTGLVGLNNGSQPQIKVRIDFASKNINLY